MQTDKPSWQAFVETGDPVWYLLYQSDRERRRRPNQTEERPTQTAREENAGASPTD